MAFIESPRFPDKISYGATGGPGFVTNIIALESGFEQRNAVWSQARCEWDVSHAARHRDEMAELLSFFRIVGGRRDGFRFKDWSDFTAMVGEGKLTTGYGDGTATYQMVKVYNAGATGVSRFIKKPISATIKITRNGSPVVMGAGAGQAAIDSTTGIVTFVADLSANASAVTVGSSTQVTLASSLGGLGNGGKVHLSGFTGVDAALLNNKTHHITGVTGSGPYVFTLAVNTVGKTITVGSGKGYKYPQPNETLEWAGEFDVPARFDTDKMDINIISANVQGWQAIPIVEIRT